MFFLQVIAERETTVRLVAERESLKTQLCTAQAAALSSLAVSCELEVILTWACFEACFPTHTPGAVEERCISRPVQARVACLLTYRLPSLCRRIKMALCAHCSAPSVWSWMDVLYGLVGRGPVRGSPWAPRTCPWHRLQA